MDLPRGLIYEPDLDNPDTHGYICPAYPMSFEKYQELLYETRYDWRRV